MRFFKSGDSALFAETGNRIDSNLSALNRELADIIQGAGTRGIVETVSSYTGFMVFYDPSLISGEQVVSIIESASGQLSSTDKRSDTGGVVIPVAYGGEYGPDLKYVSEKCGLSPSETASVHSAGDYTVHLLGFTPGFPYMGGMDGRIATPRKSEPSLFVHAGSVGIAGDQTGIYPVDSPGGWQIIGRTPLVLYDPLREPVFLLKAGMKIRFRAVDNYEFWHICEQINNGEYETERYIAAT